MARTPNAMPPSQGGKEEPVIDSGEPIVAEPEVKIEEGPATTQAASEEPAVDPAVALLRSQLADANAENERLRNTTSQQQSTIADQTGKVIEAAINTASTKKGDLLRQLTEAKEAGDIAAEVRLTDELQQLNVKLNDFTKTKTAHEQRLEDAKNQPTDPVERYAANAKAQGAPLAPEAERWLRAHPEYVSDPQKFERLGKAHSHAIGEDITPNSAEYFQHLEKRLGLTQDTRQPAAEQKTETQQKKQEDSTMPSPMPPARTGNGLDTGGALPQGVHRNPNGSYRLSAELRSTAQALGMSDAEYLKNALELQKEGRLGRQG